MESDVDEEREEKIRRYRSMLHSVGCSIYPRDNVPTFECFTIFSLPAFLCILLSP